MTVAKAPLKPPRQAVQAFLDDLVAEYKTPAYIPKDPLSLPYRYIDDSRACEMVAFLTAMFSYGRRDLIINTMSQVLQILGERPLDFLESYHPQKDAKLFKHFVYRFNKGRDLAYFIERLQWAYAEHESLERLFLAHYRPGAPEAIRNAIAGFTDAFLGYGPPDTYGMKFLFSRPEKGSACKRFNMFLRWMVRHDGVDLGLWSLNLPARELLIPLDTHVMHMNKKLGITPRQTGNWETAEAVTAFFRLLCPEDPVKYDYALFGFSLDQRPVTVFEENGWLPLDRWVS